MSLPEQRVAPKPLPGACEVTEPGRLDQGVMRAYPGVSRRLARIAILEGRVLLNGKVAKIIARSVRPGDRLLLVEQAGGSGPTPGPGDRARALPQAIVLYKDGALVVVDKPAHVLSERVPGENGHSISDLLRKSVGETSLVHRLDAGTSGVMMLARTAAANEALSAAFASKRVSKTYILLCGNPAGLAVGGEGRFEGSLGRDPKHPRRMCVRADGKAAATSYRVLATHQGVALIAAFPETGRTHQIRVHFADAGMPLLGDVMYQGPNKLGSVLFSRALLHAFALRFAHPDHGRPMQFVAPPAADFLLAIERLFPAGTWDQADQVLRARL